MADDVADDVRRAIRSLTGDRVVLGRALQNARQPDFQAGLAGESVALKARVAVREAQEAKALGDKVRAENEEDRRNRPGEPEYMARKVSRAIDGDELTGNHLPVETPRIGEPIVAQNLRDIMGHLEDPAVAEALFRARPWQSSDELLGQLYSDAVALTDQHKSYILVDGRFVPDEQENASH